MPNCNSVFSSNFLAFKTQTQLKAQEFTCFQKGQLHPAAHIHEAPHHPG